ncbi:hypothetical protein KGF45_02260 [Clostridioides sp. ZZV14-6154]|uniref:major tail protein n=1 Tax=unclassified Clostridioides TaxID=2635829 RepID=UPI001D12DB8E|nr:hypothetical protein [Clostridioides sp. ZZV14-6150]MCC0659091.1 hypothetical protein [Clostridioides sp. ZZV14-6154]
MPNAEKNYKSKIISGLKNIHVAKVNDDGTFAVPVPILGGKKVESSYEVSEDITYADDMAVDNDMTVSNGSGKMTVLGLLMDEKALIYGGDNMSGGWGLSTNMQVPNLAILFEQQKRDGGKILSVIYNAQFKPAGINATTVEEKKEKETVELEFTSLPAVTSVDDKNYFYYTVDTKDKNVSQEMIENWYKTVQVPKKTVENTPNIPES